MHQKCRKLWKKIIIICFSPENVQVNQTTRCPDHFPNAENCVQILFALPIFLAEESEYYGTYQLNHTLLERMWKDAAQYMIDPSFEIYKSPNDSLVITMWILIFCCIALLYGLFYFVSGYECTAYLIRWIQYEYSEFHRNTFTNLRFHFISIWRIMNSCFW